LSLFILLPCRASSVTVDSVAASFTIDCVGVDLLLLIVLVMICHC
jgi:hypothetical protein